MNSSGHGIPPPAKRNPAWNHFHAAQGFLMYLFFCGRPTVEGHQIKTELYGHDGHPSLAWSESSCSSSTGRSNLIKKNNNKMCPVVPVFRSC